MEEVTTLSQLKEIYQDSKEHVFLVAILSPA
jgi:hypothetical protein